MLGWARGFRRVYLVYGGAAIFCGALFVLSYIGSYGMALGLLVFSGFAMILFGISSNTKVQGDVPDALRGRVMAIYSLVFNGLMPAGSMLIGFLAKQFGIHAAIRIHASIFGACLLAILVWKWFDKQSPALEEAAAT